MHDCIKFRKATTIKRKRNFLNYNSERSCNFKKFVFYLKLANFILFENFILTHFTALHNVNQNL